MTSLDFESFVELLNSSETGSLNKLLEFSNSEPELLLSYIKQVNKTDVHNDMLLNGLSGSSYFNLFTKANKIGEDEESLNYLEKAISCCKDIPSDSGIWENVDTWATILGMKRPGKAQEILGKTKLKHLGNRIYPFNDNFALSEKALAPFTDVWFSPSKIVKSAVIFSKIPENKYITFMLYDIEKPWKEVGGGMAQFEFSSLIITISNNGEVSYTQTESEKPKSSQKSSKACFIATACYGSYDSHEVIKLKEFRDHVLLRSQIGRFFVSAYYKFSPALSEYISKKESRKRFIRDFILNRILQIIDKIPSYEKSKK